MRPRRSNARLPEGRDSISFSTREVTTRSGRTRCRGTAHCPGVSCQCLRVRQARRHLEHDPQRRMRLWALPADAWGDSGKRPRAPPAAKNQSPLLDIACASVQNKGGDLAWQGCLRKTDPRYLPCWERGYSLNYPTQKSRCGALSGTSFSDVMITSDFAPFLQK